MALKDTFFVKALGRLRREGWSLLPYTFGRFRTVRVLYSLKRRAFSRYAPLDTTGTLFPDVNVAQAINRIRQQSAYLPVHLPLAVVAELKRVALEQELNARDSDGSFSLRYQDVKNGRLANGRRVIMASVPDAIVEPRPNFAFPIMQRVAADPVVLNVMAGYLGYMPKNWNIRLYWSFATGATIAERLNSGQTSEFHFDIHSYNFAYAAYYLLDTDRTNGAHVMVAGSHKNKPISWLFGEASQRDETVRAHYPEDQVLVIEGPAGTGFWQDSSCYHKALPPQNGDRLLFQVRYF
jgi:hypothetical protein